MFIETAIKNIVCIEAISSIQSATFDYVFQCKMNDNSSNSKLQAKRLKLRNSVYSKISERYRNEENSDNQMVRHFYNRGEDIPLWVIFEILYLSDLANFYDCLNTTSRENILNQLQMLDISIDTNRTLLSSLLYTIKALRNAVAHNNIIFDTRFKDRDINTKEKNHLYKMAK